MPETDPISRTLRIRRVAPLALLILLCVLFSAMRWLKTESFWGDSARWIFEAWRAALGELAYRDFAWQYPPLSLLLFGTAFHVFGASFLVAQIVIDVISAAVVLLSWRVARLLLPPALALSIAATLACAGAGNTGNFALFSLQIYTPAVLVGMVGFLILLEPLIIRIKLGSFDGRSAVLLSLGATIALLSKPEFAMGVAGALVASAIYDGRLYFAAGQAAALWFRRQAALFALAILPGLAIYGVLAWKTGLRNLMDGLSGYGMAYLVCPWWPTGIALFGALVALCQGAAVLLLLRWLCRPGLYPLSRNTRIVLRGAAVAAIPATILYVPYCIKELPVFAGESSPARMASFFLSTGTVLLPVMWSALVLWPALAFGFGFAKRVSTETGVLLTLSTAGVLMSVRALFGGTLNQLTLATVAAYPVWFVLGPLLIERFLRGAEGTSARRASIAVLMLVAGYGLLRFGAAVASDRRSSYVAIDTAAGQVRVVDRPTSAAVYRYIVEHTSRADRVLDVSYGGAVNFAGRRVSPLFSTQFSALAPAQKYLDMDLDRIRAHPPKLVIANGQPDSGAEYGLCVETGCAFPALVWRPTHLACDPNRRFPVLEFIKHNYEPVARIGKKMIYAQKPTALAN